MPKTLSYGATGGDVATLQTTLNNRPPTALPPLAVDQIFGPKTRARVLDFQTRNHLVADGIVGPKTWAALEATAPPKVIAPRTGIDCGTSHSGNKALALSIQSQFVGLRTGGSRPLLSRMAVKTSRSMVGRSAPAPAASFSSSSPIRMLTQTQRDTAKSVFGNSLDFSRIFLSNKTGLGGRPFTIAFPDSNQIVQIMNCGTFTPKRALLIHELTHVWQSQHHNDPFRFMANAVDCQAGAVVANSAEVFNDPDVLLHVDHPVQFPFSAYAYMPGLPFAEYPAEQMANAVEHGESSMTAHVSGVAMNAVDSDTVSALQKVAFGDRRRSGIKY